MKGQRVRVIASVHPTQVDIAKPDLILMLTRPDGTSLGTLNLYVSRLPSGSNVYLSTLYTAPSGGIQRVDPTVFNVT